MAEGSGGRTYDVVYLLTESTWQQEIRYSLRSFERYFPDLGEVWIVGHLPPYLDANRVRHMPEPAMPRPGVFIESVARRLINAEFDGLSEDYIVADDDNYLLKSVTIDDFGPLWVQDLSQVANRGTGAWQLMLWRTYDLLVHMGSSGHNYESHTPVRLNRSRYAEVAERFRNTENAALRSYDSYCTITAYWNIVGNDPAARRWADHYRLGFTDSSRNESEEVILRQLENKTFLFHNDDGINDILKAVLQNLYPEKSRFEL